MAVIVPEMRGLTSTSVASIVPDPVIRFGSSPLCSSRKAVTAAAAAITRTGITIFFLSIIPYPCFGKIPCIMRSADLFFPFGYMLGRDRLFAPDDADNGLGEEEKDDHADNADKQVLRIDGTEVALPRGLFEDTP